MGNDIVLDPNERDVLRNINNLISRLESYSSYIRGEFKPPDDEDNFMIRNIDIMTNIENLTYELDRFNTCIVENDYSLTRRETDIRQLRNIILMRYLRII